MRDGVREGDRSCEGLRSPADLLVWLEQAGLLGTSERADAALRAPPTARILLTEARRLRADLGALLEARRSGEPPALHLVYALNRVLEAGPVSTRLAIDGTEPRLVLDEKGDGRLAVLAPIARDAAHLLVETEPARIRRCDAEDCRRWFVDTSRGGRRRWCSMATCGNRAKAARHRRRGGAPG